MTRLTLFVAAAAIIIAGLAIGGVYTAVAPNGVGNGVSSGYVVIVNRFTGAVAFCYATRCVDRP